MAQPKSIKDVRDIIDQDPKDAEFHPSPDAWEDQVLYFLLPDRFSDANENGYKDNKGGVVTSGSTAEFRAADSDNAIGTVADASNWRDAGTKFVGGTLKGLHSKLGYLKRLGVTALWIGPIFKQVAKLETYHGYGVQNFLDVDPRFGTREELKALIAAAHSEGIYVLLDIILNHSGNIFEYVANNPHYTGETFEVKGFYDGDRNAVLPLGPVKDSNYPDGAIWPSELQSASCFTRKGRINDDGWDKDPEYLDGDFFDLKDIALGAENPDNFQATTALLALCEIYKYWIAYTNIDGYRIDTVKHMGNGPTRYFASVIHEYAQHLGKDNFLLIGEITGPYAFETVEVTGIDAALGIGNVQEKLWKVPKGQANPSDYFDLFRNSLSLNKGSHTWFRNKVVTMIDDHDQVWRGETKGRFCSEGNGSRLIGAALMLNLCTLGIPCVYYGTEQEFDGGGAGDGADRYIREAMFGGKFGAFRSRDRHFFNEDTETFKAVAVVAGIRRQEMALSRGRQYLREIAGDGVHFGFPTKLGDGPILSIIAWSRLFNVEEVLCAINTSPQERITAWITVDSGIHPPGSTMSYLYPTGQAPVTVESRSGRSVVLLKDVLPGGLVLLK